MSVDLSDPQIAAVRVKIQDPNESTTWFLAHYATRSTSPTTSSLSSSISLLASGPEPVLPSWQEHLSDTTEDVIFGYGEIGGKGLVLLFLRDKVGGVKRARAVVHSRAVASLFPDYSALITIAHHSQLTEELITERLALNHSTSVPPPVQPKYTIPGSDHPNPLSPLAPGGPMPFLPSTSGSSRSVSAQYPLSNSAASPTHNVSPIRHRQLSGPGTPSAGSASSPHRHQPRVMSLNETPPRSASPGPILSAPITLESPISSNRAQGISSSDYFKDEPYSARSRKTSFGVRLKNTFSHRSSAGSDDLASSSEKALTQPNSPPTSPGMPRFKSSSLIKAFHRRKSSQQVNGTPPDSPQIDDFGGSANLNGGGNSSEPSVPRPEAAPPVPPKDSQSSKGLYDEPRIPLASASGSAGTLGHGEGEAPTSEPARLPNASDANGSTTGAQSVLSPSPSAKKVLYDARQKSLNAEMEIQERFRRDQEEKMREEGTGQFDDPGDDGSIRLAYDESGSEDGHAHAHPRESDVDHLQHARQRMNGQNHHNGVSLLNEDTQSTVEDTYDSENTPRVANNGTVTQAEQLSQAAEEHAEREAAILAEEDRARLLAIAEEAAEIERERLRVEREETEKRVEEERRLEEERVRLERLRLEEEERVRVEAEEAARVERELEEDRVRLEAEQKEEARLKAEAEERARIELEAAELEAERLRRIAEEEKLRREALEHAQLEKEEEEKRKVEEERRKVEEETKRKEGVRAGLAKGKSEGGVMLKGWVTVQTYKSMTWRRRYFHLTQKEMQLFKAESDIKPIQTIYIGPSSTFAERYDESQVKDSFKVVSDGPNGEEEFFLFTDSSEDKEIVLEGLRMCLQ